MTCNDTLTFKFQDRDIKVVCVGPDDHTGDHYSASGSEWPNVGRKCILCYLPAPKDGPDIDGERAHVECFLDYLALNLPHQSSGGYGPHDWSCPACIAESMRRTEYRLNNNPHRPGTKVAARWDRDRSSVDWAMDMRGETYWSM